MTIDLRHGDYVDVLADIQADVMITDPPHSERCHNGQSRMRNSISYVHWQPGDAKGLIDWAQVHVRGWWVIFTDHELWPVFDQWVALHKRYAFAPVPVINKTGMPRLAGDGPTSVTTWLHISRPRSTEWSEWGSLPGYYLYQKDDQSLIGQKPLNLMGCLIRDYSRVGMSVVDPCTGMASTLIAAEQNGRRAVGAEVNEERFRAAKARIEQAQTGDMWP